MVDQLSAYDVTIQIVFELLHRVAIEAQRFRGVEIIASGCRIAESLETGSRVDQCITGRHEPHFVGLGRERRKHNQFIEDLVANAELFGLFPRKAGILILDLPIWRS